MVRMMVMKLIPNKNKAVVDEKSGAYATWTSTPASHLVVIHPASSTMMRMTQGGVYL